MTNVINLSDHRDEDEFIQVYTIPPDIADGAEYAMTHMTSPKKMIDLDKDHGNANILDVIKDIEKAVKKLENILEYSEE